MPMLFANVQLQNALVEWRKIADVARRSEADNMWFEQRISDPRQRVFELESIAAVDADSFRNAHTDYWKTFVQVDDEAVSHTFVTSLSPADLGPIDEMQRIVRIESLVRPLNAHGINFAELKAAFDSKDSAVIDGFLRVWNTSSSRDWRPVFGAFKAEVAEDLAQVDWPSRLRDRLGLAHYDCADGPIPVALMEYSVAEVRAAARPFGVTAALTAPTVLDSGPWPYFFPAPPELPCGRTMALYEVQDDKELLAEILHFRMGYKREHLVKLGEIRTPPGVFELRSLRNHHLFALQIAAGRDDFGEEIPA